MHAKGMLSMSEFIVGSKERSDLNHEDYVGMRCKWIFVLLVLPTLCVSPPIALCCFLLGLTTSEQEDNNDGHDVHPK